jgi:catechol 2,3-dioxygenase-like lactoylglutathione lyase family enzyme
MEGTQFRYMIKFVADMNKAVTFYRDVLGLPLKFESPGWSEFVTGETTLALHPASDKNPAGKVELGFTVADVRGSLPGHERQGRALQHAAKEAGFRRGAGAVRRFRRRTLQRGRGSGLACDAQGW